MRGSSTPRPLASIIPVSGILDHPPSRVVTIETVAAACPKPSGLASPQFDLFGNLVGQADAAERQYHFRRQLFIPLETAGGDRVAHRFFDFALRGDADFLEKA